MRFPIRSRWSGTVKFEAEIDCDDDAPLSMKLRLAVLCAIKSGSNLRGSNLSGSNLRYSNLSYSNLSDSDLRDSDLSGSNLRGSNLRDSDLSGSNLSGSNLRGSNLSGSNLRYSNLSEALNVPASDASGIAEPLDYAAHAARYRERRPDVPYVESLDRKILQAIEAGGTLNMGGWHYCETTHCRGGWAIHFGGEAGYALEKKRGSAMAAFMIYSASTGRVPDFYASNADALADIREQAEAQVAGS